MQSKSTITLLSILYPLLLLGHSSLLITLFNYGFPVATNYFGHFLIEDESKDLFRKLLNAPTNSLKETSLFQEEDNST